MRRLILGLLIALMGQPAFAKDVFGISKGQNVKSLDRDDLDPFIMSGMANFDFLRDYVDESFTQGYTDRVATISLATVPKPHPLFSSYNVIVSPDGKVCAVGAHSSFSRKYRPYIALEPYINSFTSVYGEPSFKQEVKNLLTSEPNLVFEWKRGKTGKDQNFDNVETIKFGYEYTSVIKTGETTPSGAVVIYFFEDYKNCISVVEGL